MWVGTSQCLACVQRRGGPTKNPRHHQSLHCTSSRAGGRPVFYYYYSAARGLLAVLAISHSSYFTRDTHTHTHTASVSLYSMRPELPNSAEEIYVRTRDVIHITFSTPWSEHESPAIIEKKSRNWKVLRFISFICILEQFLKIDSTSIVKSIYIKYKNLNLSLRK